MKTHSYRIIQITPVVGEWLAVLDHPEGGAHIGAHIVCWGLDDQGVVHGLILRSGKPQPADANPRFLHYTGPSIDVGGDS